MPICKWNTTFQHLAAPQPWIIALQSSPLCWCCQKRLWSLVCLEWLHFPARSFQEQPSEAPAVEGSSLTASSAGTLPGSSSKEQGTHPGVCSQGTAGDSGAASGAWGSGLGCWVHFSLGIGILTRMLCSQHWYKVSVTLGRWSALLSVIINQVLLVTITSITCFFLSTFRDLYKKKQLCPFGEICYKTAVTCCVLINVAFLYSPGLLTALWRT